MKKNVLILTIFGILLAGIIVKSYFTMSQAYLECTKEKCQVEVKNMYKITYNKKIIETSDIKKIYKAKSKPRLYIYNNSAKYLESVAGVGPRYTIKYMDKENKKQKFFPSYFNYKSENIDEWVERLNVCLFESEKCEMKLFLNSNPTHSTFKCKTKALSKTK